jgi:hypothetical protein
MSKKVYDDDCQDCKPVVVALNDDGSLDTRKLLFVDEIETAWAASSLDSRAAFHRMTCLNATDAETMTLAQQVVARIQDAIKDKN